MARKDILWENLHRENNPGKKCKVKLILSLLPTPVLEIGKLGSLRPAATLEYLVWVEFFVDASTSPCFY